MDYGFKVTSRGRELQAALWATEQPLELTRVAIGDGQPPDGTNLAGVHELVHYVADGTIGARYAIGDVLHFAVQYSSNATPGLGPFVLREFLVYARDPESGQDVDFIYACLGDEANSVPAYSATRPPSLREYPLVLHLDDALEVHCTAPAGLVTYTALNSALRRAGGISALSVRLPVSGWAEDAGGEYPFRLDVAQPAVSAEQIPFGGPELGSVDAAAACRLCPCVDALDGLLRFYARSAPEQDIDLSLVLLTPGGGAVWIGEDGPPGETATEQEVREMLRDVFGGGTP